MKALICTFHMIQAVRKWILSNINSTDNTEREEYAALFRAIVYADDKKFWNEIKISEDHFILQSYIDKLFARSNIHKMTFHTFKSKVLSITNQRNILHNVPFTIFKY